MDKAVVYGIGVMGKRLWEYCLNINKRCFLMAIGLGSKRAWRFLNHYAIHGGCFARWAHQKTWAQRAALRVFDTRDQGKRHMQWSGYLEYAMLEG